MAQVAVAAAAHRTCVQTGCGRARVVGTAGVGAGSAPVTHWAGTVVRRASQGCPQGYPQPVWTDCYHHCRYLAGHPDRACCLMRLVSSVTWLKIDRRSAISERILRSACITVVWSRPPNCWPILGSDMSVSSRHRYMAICRAVTSTRDREVPQRSSMDRPKYDAVWPMMVDAVMSGPCVSTMRSLSTNSASCRSTDWRLRLANA